MIRHKLLPALGASLLLLGGCGAETLSSAEAETMLESVYLMDFTYVESTETTTEDGTEGVLYTFQDPAGLETHLLSYVQDGQAVGESDRTQVALIQAADRWNGLCEDSGIAYEQEGGVWRLTLHTDGTEDALALASFQAAELIRAMLDSAPIFEIQTPDFVHQDVIQVYYQSDPERDQATYLCGFHLAEQSICTVEYTAYRIQMWMREVGVLGA